MIIFISRVEKKAVGRVGVPARGSARPEAGSGTGCAAAAGQQTSSLTASASSRQFKVLSSFHAYCVKFDETLCEPMLLLGLFALQTCLRLLIGLLHSWKIQYIILNLEPEKRHVYRTPGRQGGGSPS